MATRRFWNMIRSFPEGGSCSTALTCIADNFIVCNVPTTSITREAEREEQLDYVAEHLAPRAALISRLRTCLTSSREISRTEMEVLSILTEGPRRITEL